MDKRHPHMISALPRPKLDPDQAIREHNSGRSSPPPFQVWKLTKPKTLHSSHYSEQEAREECRRLQSEENKQADREARKPTKVVGVWSWETGEELKP